MVCTSVFRLDSNAVTSPDLPASRVLAWVTLVIASWKAWPLPARASAVTWIRFPIPPPGSVALEPTAVIRLFTEVVSWSQVSGEWLRSGGITAPSASVGPST